MSDNKEDIKAIERTALAWPDRVARIRIIDQQSYDDAYVLVTEIVTLRRRIQEHHKPLKDKAFAAHKAIVAAEKKMLDPLQQAETAIKRALGAWYDEQDRLRREEQARLEAAQRKADEEARLALAVEAEQNGATSDTLEEILDTPVVAPAIVAQPTYRRANGISTQQRWRAEVIDLKALCLAIGQGRASINLVMANLPALNSMARAMKQTFSVPGCKAVAETAVAVQAR